MIQSLLDLWLALPPLWGQVLAIFITLLICAGAWLGAWCLFRMMDACFEPIIQANKAKAEKEFGK